MIACGDASRCDEGLFPSRLVFGFAASRQPGRYYAGMWGGGFMRLED